ncbi:uncharacterized protein COLE_04219 [Cutaneotrichosporon oleaginosum]|uniref:uncharacterized protein n=1 Tax=Cutaneotrichosporon oleaginosum TaxID=879819 RepID=UPI0013293F2F|nr:hypothetical protein COLE_04219 [Cutaneotrichosporon oleaginosum]
MCRGEGGHPTCAAASHLRRQGNGRRQDDPGLQDLTRDNYPPRARPARRLVDHLMPGCTSDLRPSPCK